MESLKSLHTRTATLYAYDCPTVYNGQEQAFAAVSRGPYVHTQRSAFTLQRPTDI